MSNLRKSFSKFFFPKKKETLDLDDQTSTSEKKIDMIDDVNIKNQCRRSMSIKNGARRIFSISKNFFQQLDAAKAVLVSTKHIEAVTANYINLHLKNNESNSVYKGQITLSNIKVPLVWRSLNNTLIADGVYILFCIIKAEGEICETQMFCDINHTMNDVEFNDVIQINNISYDSPCLIELYAKLQSNGYSKKLISRKTPNSPRSPRHQNVEHNDDNDKIPFFQLLGSVQLTVKDVSKKEMSHNLQDYKCLPDCKIPLFGTLSCKYIMTPMSKIQCVFSRKTQIQFLSHEGAKPSEIMILHCEIKDKAIHCWNYTCDIEKLLVPESKPLVEREDVETADHIIPILKETKLLYEKTIDENQCIKICTYFDELHTDYQEILIFDDNVELWYEVLSTHINEQEIWGDLFLYDNIECRPTSFLRFGSVCRTSKNSKY